MVVDPALQLLISLLLGALLLAASLHKFSDRVRFRGILGAYRILPNSLLAPASIAIPLIELALGLAWLSGVVTSSIAIASAGLLGIYALAITINIQRGNIHIDCGCSFTSSGKDASYEQLSYFLVFRNIVLLVLALAALAPVNTRDLNILDYGLLFLACTSLVFIYGAFNQLLANRAIIKGSSHGGALRG